MRVFRAKKQCISTMKETIQIRESKNQDKCQIKALHLQAFDKSEAEIVAQLAIDLLEDETAKPVLSLVAEDDGEIVGNIIFSSIKAEGAERGSAYILAPLAVAKEFHGCGIGTQLINQGLQALRERGAEIVLVLGDPNYYSRTGFKAGHRIKPPYKLGYPPEAWMAQELVKGALEKAQGKIQCAKCLNSPELW